MAKEKSPRDVRVAANVTQLAVAAEVGCSIALVRLYELGGPNAVTQPHKRNAFARVYARLSQSPNPPPSAA